MERQIDFARDRQMLCGICNHQWTVDLDWIDRWEQSHETCPGCGTTCEHADSPRVTISSDDPALDDERVVRFSWYHTSTQPEWPPRDFDPAAVFTPETRMMMGGDRPVAEWAARQRAKALHVGTYEAAVHNMLRRIRDQADGGSQFYLYRVYLKQSAVVRKGWLIDPSNCVGDVMLDEVCPRGIDVARYLNLHEDPGGLSLALGRDAIASVQRIMLPLPDMRDETWMRETIEALTSASDVVVELTGKLGRFVRSRSPRAVLAAELSAALADRVPVNLRDQFMAAAVFAEGDDPARWARRVSGLAVLFDDPWYVLEALDRQEHRSV